MKDKALRLALESIKNFMRFVWSDPERNEGFIAIDAINQALLEPPEIDWESIAKEQAEVVAKMTCEKYPFVHIRIDATEAEKEGALRDKLIELGWKPPGQ
jgi:hypothetical protein